MSAPKSALLGKHRKDVNLLIKGQGVFIFNVNDESDCKECSFSFSDHSGQNFIRVQFTQDHVHVSQHESLAVINLVDQNNHTGLVTKEGAYYWCSLDAQNLQLYAGIGEARIETVIYRYSMKGSKKWVEQLVSITNHSNDIIPRMILRDPVTMTIPMIVKPTNELSMDIVAANTYMPKANLSLVSQKMYDCISGKQFVLDNLDFPDFSKAIEYSIATPGLWCYKTLKKKSTEFNPDKPDVNETYLRITLGQNNGESPGIPYVMEIWPPGHYSPVHNHAGAEAIIRVLYGQIHVHLYPFLSKDAEKFGTSVFSKDDITWISPTLNQIHKLENTQLSPPTTCITVQCYMYDGEDIAHYDYFDYLNTDGQIQQFEPDSDMDFITFKDIIRQEWENRNTTCCFFR
jgi:hypothetical protein